LLKFDDFSVTVADGWDDVTDSLEDPGAPLTVADPVAGVGALQFSVAVYESGVLPHVSSTDLKQMLAEMAASRRLRGPFDQRDYPGRVAIVGQSYHDGEDFVRIWYGSDGKNVMLMTYVCDWSQREREHDVREMTVLSLQFRAKQRKNK
jgi:hypothetical protein